LEPITRAFATAANRTRGGRLTARLRSRNYINVIIAKRGVFRSVADLQAAINRFVEETNSDPKPFVLDR
jgi:hypothetical protein